MNHGVATYYGNSSLYKNEPYRIKENFNSITSSTTPLKKVKIVALEVPISAIPFTIYCNKKTEISDENLFSSITVLTEKNVEIIDIINDRMANELEKIRSLHSKMECIDLNLMGYLLLNEKDTKFYIDEMFFYDLYINENWIDYPILKKILNIENIDLRILPEVYIGEYETSILRAFLGTSSLLNRDYKVEKMIVKPYFEPYGVTCRNSVGFFEYEELKVVEIPKIEKEKIILAINKNTAPLCIYKDDVVFTKVKTVFDVFFSKRKDWEELIIETGVVLKVENKMFFFGFIRSTLTNYIYTHWDVLTTINVLDIKKIEKAIGKYTFLFCKNNFDFFGNKVE